MTAKDNNRFLNIAAGIFLAFFSVYVIKELSSILIPLVLAIIISFVFEPLYAWMRSKKVPVAIAIIVVLLTIIIIVNSVGLLIVASVESFSSNFTIYEERLIILLHSVIESLHLSAEDKNSIFDYLKVSNLLQQGNITSFLSNFLSGFVAVFGDFVIVLFYIIFILSEFANIKDRIKAAYPEARAENIVVTLDTIFYNVRKYIAGKTVISLVLGFLSGLVLWIFGVDFYIIWGFLIFIMHFIPNIGALIALSLPAIVMLLQFDNIFTPVLVTIMLVVLQNVIGNIVEPKVLGGHLNLSPLLLLISLFLGGYVWGIVGMVLSVPIVSMLKIVMMNFESTKPIAILMSYKTTTFEADKPENPEQII